MLEKGLSHVVRTFDMKANVIIQVQVYITAQHLVYLCLWRIRNSAERIEKNHQNHMIRVDLEPGWACGYPIHKFQGR